VENKVCIICKSEFPKTTEYFYPNGKYISSNCRECNNKKSREWRENNPERQKELNKKNYKYIKKIKSIYKGISYFKKYQNE
jgi:hypothetical protein